MKRLCLILIVIIMLTTLNVCYAKVGDVIGYAGYTDIVATINGAQIPSYNVDGDTYIVAEDLSDYGFNVVWKPDERLIEINRNYSARYIYSDYKKPYISPKKIGQKAFNILDTNINASLGGYHLYSYVKGKFTCAYNINGRTVIPFDMMEIFGTVSWDGAGRVISLTIPGINVVGGERENSWIVKDEFLNRAYKLQANSEEFGNTAVTQRDLNSGSWLCYCSWDVLLNEIYQYLKTNLSPAEFEALKYDEIEWIKQKEHAMSEMEKQYYGGSIMPLMVNTAGEGYTSERCYYLISLIK